MNNRLCCCDAVQIIIMICILLSNAAYGSIAPMLPLEFEKKGISTVWIGIVFSMYSLGVMFMSPMAARLLPRLGKPNSIGLGMAGMGLSMVCFGLIGSFNNINTILILSNSNRFLQGSSSAFINTACYSIATNNYPDNKEMIVGLVEATAGIGLFIGPAIFSIVYARTDSMITFLSLGIIILLIAFLVFSCLLVRLDDVGEENLNMLHGSSYCNNDDDNDHKTTTVTTAITGENGGSGVVRSWDLLTNPRFTLALGCATLNNFQFSYFEPILAPRLDDNFGLSTEQIGWFFTLFLIFYIPTSLAVQWIPHWIDKRVTLAVSIFFCSIFLFMFGPSQLLRFPDSLTLMGIGKNLLGIASAVLLIPVLPEMVETALPSWKGQEERVNNLSSGLFSSFCAIGQLVGPIFGSVADAYIGWRLTTDIVAILGLVYLVLFCIFVNLPDAIKLTTNAWRKGPKNDDNMNDEKRTDDNRSMVENTMQLMRERDTTTTHITSASEAFKDELDEETTSRTENQPLLSTNTNRGRTFEPSL